MNPDRPPDAGIVVVESDPHVRRFEHHFLERRGYAVAFVSRGDEALDRVREHRPRLVITEILVPGRDGLSICRELKSDSFPLRVDVLILSILEARERSLEVGADAFLRKPLDPARLVETIQELDARRP